MPWRAGVISICLLAVCKLAFGGEQALWREFGLAETHTAKNVTSYRMKDLTGALAVWQWQRSADDRPCPLAPFCAQNSARTLIFDNNYVVVFSGPAPAQRQVDETLNALPNKRNTSLPAILTFVPRQGLVANSSRYILGEESLRAFAAPLGRLKPGFSEGAEAQVGRYEIDKKNPPAQLALFYYPTPEMARIHAQEFKTLPNVRMKRSGVLVALVFDSANDLQAETLLGRVQYEARLVWNDIPPPNPVKPLYRLLLNIMWMSVALSVLALLTGLLYAGMRVYRRRYGNLDSEEAMTTLHLRGE